MDGKRNYSLGFIAFLQALGLTAYCSLVAFLLWHSNQWFGKIPSYFAPFLFLTLFTTSALISAIITLGYPFLLWQKKQTRQAVRLVFYTVGWLISFTLLLMLTVFSLH